MKYFWTLTRAAACGLLIGTAVPAHATPSPSATWTISNAVFDDGTAVSGQFTYDAVADKLLSYAISVATGTLPGLTYDATDSYLQTSIASGYWAPNELTLAANDGSSYIVLTFGSSLSNDGGQVALLTDSNSLTTASWQSSGDGSVTRYIIKGDITAQTANLPEPGSLGLAVAALGGLVVVRTRRRKQAGLEGLEVPADWQAGRRDARADPACD